MVVGQRINVKSASFIQDNILKDLIKNKDNNMSSVTTTTTANPPTDTGKNLRSVILRADLESRLVVGLQAAVKQLSVEPDNTLFCILITPRTGDSAQHMQEVLLRAFCFENDIYIVQVDSAEKLGRLLNSPCDTCVLVQRSPSGNHPSEESLIDFCEDYWDAPIQPVVKLPES